MGVAPAEISEKSFLIFPRRTNCCGARWQGCICCGELLRVYAHFSKMFIHTDTRSSQEKDAVSFRPAASRHSWENRRIAGRQGRILHH
jgi:hypothetical protein